MGCSFGEGMRGAEQDLQHAEEDARCAGELGALQRESACLEEVGCSKLWQSDLGGIQRGACVIYQYSAACRVGIYLRCFGRAN